jgi:hypothetical protein
MPPTWPACAGRSLHFGHHRGRFGAYRTAAMEQEFSARFMLRVFAIAGALVFGISFAVLALLYTLPLPSPTPRALEDALRAADRLKLSALISADQYCLLGLGRNPYVFSKQAFPDHLVWGEDERFRRRSSHWHVLATSDKTSWAFPIDNGKISLADDLIHPICAPDLLVSSVDARRHGQETRLLSATAVTPRAGGSGQPKGSDATSDCLPAIERYIDLIDDLMTPIVINASHVTKELGKYPGCQVDDEAKLIELAKNSRYFDHYHEGVSQLTIMFRTTENRHDFEVSLSFDRTRRVILHGSGGHKRKL